MPASHLRLASGLVVIPIVVVESSDHDPTVSRWSAQFRAVDPSDHGVSGGDRQLHGHDRLPPIGADISVF